MIIVNEADIARDEPAPHSDLGMTTRFGLTDTVPNRRFDFRKRSLHKGAALGLHHVEHDEVYYVVSGEGDVTSDGETRRLTPGMMAYLYKGALISLTQVGEDPLVIILTYTL